MPQREVADPALDPAVHEVFQSAAVLLGSGGSVADLAGCIDAGQAKPRRHTQCSRRGRGSGSNRRKTNGYGVAAADCWLGPGSACGGGGLLVGLAPNVVGCWKVGFVATRVFADEELARLREFPEIGREELFRFFTLSPADLAFVDPGRGRGPADRLGIAIALCTLPWLGFVPDRVVTAPPVAVARLAEQLRLDGTEIRSYGRRAQTRTDHLRLVAQYLGWRAAGALELEELDEFLLARAMEHDSPTLLFRLGCEYLISARVIRPGPVSMVERVAHAREQAQRETYDRLAHEFTPARCAELDALLTTDVSLGVSRLRWLSTGPVEASAAAVRAEVDKLAFLRGLGADRLDMSVLPAERRRFLATMGRRLTPQALERRDPQRRYPILLTVLAQSGTDVLDEVVALFDQAISAKFGAAERRMQQELAERGKSGEDRQALLDDLLAIVTDPAVADEEIGALIRGDAIGWERLRAAIAQAKPRLPRDHGHLAALDSSYNYLRQFTPRGAVDGGVRGRDRGDGVVDRGRDAA